MSTVIKVQPWGKDQGDHVLINAEDFDENIHKKVGEVPEPPAEPADETKSKAAAKPATKKAP